MASKEGEDNNNGFNTETEEETVAFHKKRSRRVSFAETTAIHLFVREEDCETPSDSSNSAPQVLDRTESDEIRELLDSSDDSDNDNGDINGNIDGDDAVAVRGSFLRPSSIGSPSPGSNFGSATSNDEDNFFGPVSTDFIKSRRLSDSAASDENHDITMDSTAFSMHFRSLVKSSAGGEFRTPTGSHVASGEKTSGQVSTATSTGDLMVLTGIRKPVACSPLLADKVTDSGGNSDDMSLVCENRRSYDYGKLPAELNVLLAEGGEDLNAVSVPRDVEFSNSTSLVGKGSVSAVDANQYEFLHSQNCQDANISMQKVSADVKSAPETNSDDRKDGVAAAALGEGAHGNSCNVDISPVKTTPEKNKNEALMPLTNGALSEQHKTAKKGANGVDGKLASPLASNPRLNLDSNQHSMPSDAGSVSSLLAKRRQIFKVLADSTWEKPHLLSLENQLGDKESIKHVSSMSNSTKYLSRLKRLEDFPFSSTSKVESYASRLLTPGHLTSSQANHNPVGDKSKDILVSHVDVPVAHLEAHFSNVAEKDGDSQSISRLETSGVRSPKDHEVSSNIEEITNDAELNTISITLLSQDKSTKITSAMVSPSSVASGKKELGRFVSIDSNAEETPLYMPSYSSLAEISFSDMKFDTMSAIHNDSTSALANKVEKNVLASPNGGKVLSTDVNQQDGSHNDAVPNNVQNVSSRTENLTGDANVHQFVGKPSDTPRSNSLITRYDGNEEPLVCDSNNSSHSKRKYEGLFCEAEDKNDGTHSSHRNSKLFKYQNKLAESGGESHSTGDQTVFLQSSEAFTSFCGAIGQLLSPWSDKLDLTLIGTVYDALVHLEKKKSHELLQQNLHFQNDHAQLLRDKRVMTTKLLLHRNVYEKAKLQLMRLKRDKLSDQLQRLKSGVQETEMLMSSCRLVGQRKILVNCSESESSLTKNDKRSSVPDDLTPLREQLNVSNAKIKNLVESISSHLMLTENKTCSQTTECAKDFLKRRLTCRSLLSELQLCEIESFKTVNGEHNILFDHLGFMSQRFICNSDWTSDVSVSNKLHNRKISKLMFQSMDASIAFSFVLSGDTTLKCASWRSITRETQKTTLLLHNLLDVVEEVALAMSELKSLTQSKFSQPSAEKLDLQFCFWDFKSCAKVTLSIDVSCLNRGIYPSQVLPSEVQVTAAGKHGSFQSLLSSIETAVLGLRCGYMRIITLCRCVSTTIQAISGT